MLKSKLINNKKAAIQEAAAIKLDGMKKWEHTHNNFEHNKKNFNEVNSGARMSQPFSYDSHANYMNFRQSENYKRHDELFQEKRSTGKRLEFPKRALSPNDRMFLKNDRDPNPDEIFQAEQDLNKISLMDKDLKILPIDDDCLPILDEND